MRASKNQSHWISICRAAACGIFAALSPTGADVAYSQDLNLSIWKSLVSYRPAVSVQREIMKRGEGWRVHRIENADSFLNLDYYALKITKYPTIDHIALDGEQVFSRLKRHLVDPKRASAKRVEFLLSQSPETIDTPGTLLRLRFRPYTMASCRTLAYCADVSFLKDSKICDWLDAKMEPILGQGSFDDAYVAVAMSSPKELRVCTIQGGRPLLAPFTEGTGKHPVAGNRAFGYTSSQTGMTLYVIGADRFNGIAPRADDHFASWGYCSAEIFWREFLNEFETWIALQNEVWQYGRPLSGVPRKIRKFGIHLLSRHGKTEDF
jgi:hypothetical protein